MGEDCLALNVVAPCGAERAALPVMFFVHVGGYIFGSSATGLYDGAAIARRGAVYVSANYRLGALGCLDLSSLATPEYPLEPNLFLRDLVWLCVGCATTSPGSAATRTTSRSSARAQVPTPWRPLLAVPEAAVVARRLVTAMGAKPADGARGDDARPSVLVRTLERWRSFSRTGIPATTGRATPCPTA